MASKKGYYQDTDDPKLQNYSSKFETARLLDFRWSKKKKKKRHLLHGGLK